MSKGRVGAVLAFWSNKENRYRSLSFLLSDMEQTEPSASALDILVWILCIPGRDDLDAEGLKKYAVWSSRTIASSTIQMSNFLLLGFLLEKWFGQDLAQIFQEQVFTPWQMKNCTVRFLKRCQPFVTFSCNRHDQRVLGPCPGVLGPLEIWKFSWSIIYGSFAKSFPRTIL